ncbi:hypothetical protein PENARI_c006G08663 [Penicillium arizonense]|uniref:Uncharacterized protein n=1 Tax=Penicillium arizonense TaxID=1835702 RepID=A0A1F5LMR4_PENAI|nr:hypothetical protein PENARI_c006G08663 [Penicillium arizonense]OGE54425.1 hypothetical protein PENARI_c006G08663 [Penicillium arizonense]
MSSQLPPGGILFDTGKDKDRDKNGKRPQSMHFPLPFTPTMSPIVYPATTSNTSKMNKENKLDMNKGKGVDDADTPKPVQFPMPNNRTAFLCPHGLHISDTIADDAGPGPGPSSQNYLQTRCLVCDVMREYHPYQPQTADPTVGEQWIRYMDYICGVRDERIMGEIGAVRDVADRVVSLAESLLARQTKLLADLRKMNDAPVEDSAEEGNDESKEWSTEELTEDEKKEKFKKAVRNKILIDEKAAKNELENEAIDVAFRIAVQRMEWMDEETLRESLKIIDDEEKEELVLKHIKTERKRIADEKKVVDENNAVKKRHGREKKKSDLMDIILKTRHEDEKKEAEDKHMADVMNAILDQRIADQKKAEKMRVEKKKKAGKKKQAEVKEAGDDNKLDVKPTGTGSKRDIYNFTGSGPSN